MKKSVYLDATIPSYLFDERESIREYIAVTKDWWDAESRHFDIYVSEETIAELSAGDYPRKAELLGFVAQFQVLPPDEQILEIARVYLDNYLMPRVFKGDALHLALRGLLQVRFSVDLELQPFGECQQAATYPHYQRPAQSADTGDYHAVGTIHGGGRC